MYLAWSVNNTEILYCNDTKYYIQKANLILFPKCSSGQWLAKVTKIYKEDSPKESEGGGL